MKARISADTIGRYIGCDKSISAYRLSVKFHRYANPGTNTVDIKSYVLKMQCIFFCYRIEFTNVDNIDSSHFRTNHTENNNHILKVEYLQNRSLQRYFKESITDLVTNGEIKNGTVKFGTTQNGIVRHGTYPVYPRKQQGKDCTVGLLPRWWDTPLSGLIWDLLDIL